MTLQESVKTLYKKLKYHIGNNGEAHALADEYNAGFISPEEKKIVGLMGGIEGGNYNLLPLTSLNNLKDANTGFNWSVWDFDADKTFTPLLQIVEDPIVPIVGRKLSFTVPNDEVIGRTFISQDIPASQKTTYRDVLFPLKNDYTLSAYVKSSVDIEVEIWLERISYSEKFLIKAGERTKLVHNFFLNSFVATSTGIDSGRCTAGVTFFGLKPGDTVELDSLKVGIGANNSDFNHSIYELNRMYGNKLYNLGAITGDLYNLKEGMYEFLANSDTLSNLPIQLVGAGTFYGSLFIKEGYEGRRQFVLCQYYGNLWFVGNTHTNQTTINWTKMMQTQSGTGTPEGKVYGSLGSMYIDITTGYVYIKTQNTVGMSGWTKLQTTT